MIRLAVVIETLGRGGAERLLVDTARLLDRRRFALRIYTIFPVRRDYLDALRALEVPEECLDLAGPHQIPEGIRRLRSRLRDQPTDVVHTHLFSANIVGRMAARLEGRPVVTTYHDADYEPVVRRGNRGLTPAKQTLLRVADAATCRISRARIVTVSEYVAASVHRRLFIPRERISVIYNAVDTAVFAPDEVRRNATRDALGLTPATSVVVCVGRLTLQKGQDVLLRAFAEVRRAVPGSLLLLVGDGIQRAELEALARHLEVQNAVRFLGVRTDVPDLLRAADLLVLPSRHEGFGLVLAEAMACGIPVVASRTGPVPEIVRDDETGRLFAPEDATGLARALTDLLQDPTRRHVLGENGRKDVRDRFTLPLMVSRLQSLYAELADRQAS